MVPTIPSKNNKPPALHPFGQSNNHLRKYRQLSSKALEKALKLRYHFHKKNGRCNNRDNDNCNWVSHRLLNFLL